MNKTKRKAIIGGMLAIYAALCKLIELGGAWLLGINIQGMNYLEYMIKFYSVPWHTAAILILYIVTGWILTNNIDRINEEMRRKIEMEQMYI